MNQLSLAAASQSKIRILEAGHVLERVIVSSPVLEIGPRHADVGGSLARFTELDHPLARRIRQRAQQNRLHYTVFAPTPRASVKLVPKRSRATLNGAKAVMQILQKALEAWKSPRLLRFFLDQGRVPEFAPCYRRCLFGRHALRCVLFR